MGSPYLSTNESIILSAHDVIINTVPAEVILTNQRLMLVDKTHPRILPQDIPFSAIETITIGDNTGNDPVLSLSILTPDGTRQPLGMVYPQGPRVNRASERDEWAARLKELSVISQHETGVVAMDLSPPWVPGQIPEEPVQGDVAEVVPAGTRFKSPSISERRSRTAGASTTHIIGIAAAFLIVIAIVVVGVYFYAPSLLGQPTTPATPAPTATPTQAATPVPTPTEALTPGPTPEQTIVLPTQVQSAVPPTGVWVLVKYEGIFEGRVGAPGRFKEVSGSGNQFFQIPAKNEIVTASITKTDNSGNPLTIEFYNEGVLINSATITKPKGTLDLDADLRIVAPSATP